MRKGKVFLPTSKNTFTPLNYIAPIENANACPYDDSQGFGLGNTLHIKKLLRTLKSFCVCGFYISMFIILIMKNSTYNLFN